MRFLLLYIQEPWISNYEITTLKLGEYSFGTQLLGVEVTDYVTMPWICIRSFDLSNIRGPGLQFVVSANIN